MFKISIILAEIKIVSMATLTLMLDKRNKAAIKFPLIIRVHHKRMPKNIQTGFKLSDAEWNENKKQIKKPFPNATKANIAVNKKMIVASEVISELGSHSKTMTVYQIADLINEKIDNDQKSKSISKPQRHKKTTLFQYGQLVIARYEKAGRFGMVNSFRDSVNQLLKYKLSDDELWAKINKDKLKGVVEENYKLQKIKNSFFLSDVDKTFLEDFEAHYISKINGTGKKNTLNGLGVHLRSIRRIFNLAIEDKSSEITLEDYPFGKGGYSIKKTNTSKRAVKIDVLKKINELDYEKGSALWHHRNYFLFTFYMRGMNFIDLSYLTMENIEGNRLVYKRRKTRRGSNVKEFNIKIPSEAMVILNFYAGQNRNGDLVFPILEEVINCGDERKIYDVYGDRIKNHNRRLNTISKAIGLNQNLTTYVARHTFATAGLHKGISKAQIGDMLGHTNYYTTESYLSDFENEVLDDAADKIFE